MKKVRNCTSGNRNINAFWKLSFCVWELTKRCNLACVHCGSGAGAAREQEWTRDEALGVATQLIELGCRRVTLIGGEVLLCPWWSDVASSLVSGGTTCDIISNGYAWSGEDIEKIVNSNIASVAVSVDGFADTHNALRGKSDAFSRLEAFCSQIRRTGIPLTAVTTITKPALADLDRMCAWVKEQGVSVWQWQQVSPMGRAAGHKCCPSN